MPNIAVSKPAPPIAQHPVIKTKGMKGFLQWMQSDPTMSVVYQQIQPQLAQLLKANPVGSTMNGLGCCYGGSCFYCGGGGYSCSSVTAAAPTDAVNSLSLVNSVANLINTGASVALTANQIANANAVTNAQLQQAAAGRSPLNLSTTGGMVSSGSSLLTGTLFGLPTWLVLAGGVGALILVSKK